MRLRPFLLTALWIVCPVAVVVAIYGTDVPWRFTGWNEMPGYRLAVPLLYPVTTGLAAALACRRTGIGIRWTQVIGAALLAAVIVLMPAAPWLLGHAEQNAEPGSPVGFARFDCLRWILAQVVLFATGPFLLPLFDPRVRNSLKLGSVPNRRYLFPVAAVVALIAVGVAILLTMASSGATDRDHALLETGLFLILSSGGIGLGLVAFKVFRPAAWLGSLGILTYLLMSLIFRPLLGLLPISS